MKPIHTLLQRQLKRCFGAADGSTVAGSKEAAWDALLQAVNEAYHEFDMDRGMLEHSMEMSSRELLQANTVMRAMVQDLSEAQARLQQQSAALMELVKSPVIAAGPLDAAWRQITETAAHTLEAARASIWLFDDGRHRLRCADLFERAAARHSVGVELSAADYPSYFRALESERMLSANDALADERTAEFVDAYLRPLGIASMLDASIWRSSRIMGVVCLEHVGAARRWTPEDERFAASLADTAALVLEAAELRRAERQLESKLREVELLNRVMMGREERILDLKERIRQLQSEPPRSGGSSMAPTGTGD